MKIFPSLANNFQPKCTSRKNKSHHKTSKSIWWWIKSTVQSFITSNGSDSATLKSHHLKTATRVIFSKKISFFMGFYSSFVLSLQLRSMHISHQYLSCIIAQHYFSSPLLLFFEKFLSYSSHLVSPSDDHNGKRFISRRLRVFSKDMLMIMTTI